MCGPRHHLVLQQTGSDVTRRVKVIEMLGDSVAQTLGEGLDDCGTLTWTQLDPLCGQPASTNYTFVLQNHYVLGPTHFQNEFLKLNSILAKVIFL